MTHRLGARVVVTKANEGRKERRGFSEADRGHRLAGFSTDMSALSQSLWCCEHSGLADTVMTCHK